MYQSTAFVPRPLRITVKRGTGKQHTGLKAKKIFLQFLSTHQLLCSAAETEAATISGGNLAYHSLGLFFFLLLFFLRLKSD